jgi:hypothetical protein
MGKTGKSFALFSFLTLIIALAYLTNAVLAIDSLTIVVDQPWWRTTGINQPTQFTAHAKGGTPPYTYQWYVTYLDPNIPPENWSAVAVPNSNTSTFQFVESTLGKYGISLRITDSNGESEYESFQPMGIVVTVQSSPVAQPSTSTSPSPSVTELSYLAILPILLTIPIVLITVRKRFQGNV